MAETTDDRLLLLIQRIERMSEEKKGIQDDIKDIYAEAKAVGYSPVIMREIVKIRAMKPEDRELRQAELDTYMAALGIA